MLDTVEPQHSKRWVHALTRHLVAARYVAERR